MRENGRNERPKNGAGAQPCLSDVYKNSTRARRRQADGPFSGRSMVEMLGVLAIIGVLSVGAIAGYSKAMLKYKLNKQAEQLNTIFNTAALYAGKITIDNTITNNITSTFISLGAVPKEMIRPDTKSYVYDVFGLRVAFYVTGSQNTTVLAGKPQRNAMMAEVYLNPGEDDLNVEICRNVVKTGKENAPILHALETYGMGINENTQTIYYGQDSCQPSGRCIAALDLDKIDALCRGFTEESTATTFRIWIFV